MQMEMKDRKIEELNEQFDSTMREKLAGFEPVVPHALWNRIATELDADTATIDDSHTIPHHHSSGGFSKWRMAIAAAILLTLTVGGILYSISPKTDGTLNVSPVASTNAPATNVTAAAITESPAAAAKTVAQTSAATAQHSDAVAVREEPKNTTAAITASNNEQIINTVANGQAKQEPAMTADDKKQMEDAPVATQNNAVDVGNIPVYSLNFLSTPHTMNDEITVIKSTDGKKKKHHGKEEEATKVIMIGKKYESKPDINYQIPLRF